MFLNGKSLGAQKINANASPRVWKVPFAPGSLTAVAKNGGKVVAKDKLHTAGKAEKIIFSAETRKLSAGVGRRSGHGARDDCGREWNHGAARG